MDSIPAELWVEIARLACTDGGATGGALSLVSRYMHDTVQPVRYYSVVIGSSRSASRFASLLETQHRAPVVVRHLMIRSYEPWTGRDASRFEELAPEEAVRRLLRCTAPTLHTLFWHEALFYDRYDILPSLVFPVLRDLSIPTVNFWRGLSATPFPALRRLHLHDIWRDEPGFAWKVIAQVCPNISAIRLSCMSATYAGDLPHFLRMLLHVTTKDCAAAPAATSGGELYGSGSATEEDLLDLATRLSGVVQVTVQEAIDPLNIINDTRSPVAEARMTALQDIVQACAEGTGERRLCIFPEAFDYGERTAWMDWLEVVEGGDGPWSVEPSVVGIEETRCVVECLYSVFPGTLLTMPMFAVATRCGMRSMSRWD